MDEGRHWMSQDMSPHQPRDKRRPRRRSRIITAGDEEGAAGANHQSEKLGALRPKEAKRMLARKLRSWTPVAGTCIYALDDSSGCMWPAMLLGIVGTRAYFRWINPSDGVLYADPTSVRLSDIEKFPEYGVLDQYDALSDPDDCIEFDENELEDKRQCVILPPKAMETLSAVVPNLLQEYPRVPCAAMSRKFRKQRHSPAFVWIRQNSNWRCSAGAWCDRTTRYVKFYFNEEVIIKCENGSYKLPGIYVSPDYVCYSEHAVEAPPDEIWSTEHGYDGLWGSHPCTYDQMVPRTHRQRKD